MLFEVKISQQRAIASCVFFTSICFFQILLHMGLLADESGWKIADNAFKGGPLGELVQWADVISSIYLLGHDVTVSTSSNDLKRCVFRDFCRHSCVGFCAVGKGS